MKKVYSVLFILFFGFSAMASWDEVSVSAMQSVPAIRVLGTERDTIAALKEDCIEQLEAVETTLEDLTARKGLKPNSLRITPFLEAWFGGWVVGGQANGAECIFSVRSKASGFGIKHSASKYFDTWQECEELVDQNKRTLDTIIFQSIVVEKGFFFQEYCSVHLVELVPMSASDGRRGH